MKILVIFTGSGSTYSLQVAPSCTVLRLKEQMFEVSKPAEKVVPQRQRIIFAGTDFFRVAFNIQHSIAGKGLDDMQVLSEVGITEGSVLHLLERLACVMHDDYDPSSLRVNVTIVPEKQTHVFRMGKGSTVEDLKGRIQDKMDVPVRDQRLMLKGRQIYSGHLSSFCSKILEERLELTLRKRCLIHVRLTAFNGEAFDYHIPSSATVGTVRKTIAKHEGFDDSMRLVYGDILEDEKTLGDYEAVETEMGRIGVVMSNAKAGRVGEDAEVFLVGGRRSVYLNYKKSQSDTLGPSWLHQVFSCFC